MGSSASRQPHAPPGDAQAATDAARRYVGQELGVFAHAHRWKAYLRAQIAPFLGRRVLEVGAGLGATARALGSGHSGDWVALEPDPELARAARELGMPSAARVIEATLATFHEPGEFDSVLYVDVLEHIADDRGELALAASRLAAGGHLVVLSPAHQFLFSPFDEAIGHHRRYDRGMLRAVAPASLELVRCRYLDALGLLPSAGNRLILASAQPTRRQIQLWDRMVGVSRWLDPCLGYHVGKSILAIWRRPGGNPRR